MTAAGDNNGTDKKDVLDEAFFDSDGKSAGKALVDEAERAELERILQPGRGRSKHPVLAGIVIAASVAVMWMMWKDTVYFFRSRHATDLGAAAKALKQGKLAENTYVRIKGTPDLNTKANVSRRGCGLAPKSAPKSYYNFYVLVGTGDAVVVRRSLSYQKKMEEEKHPVIEMDVIGRLVRFKSVKAFFRSYANFISAVSRKFPALQHEHDFSVAELRKHLGKHRTTMRDRSGTSVQMRPETSVSLYVVFPDELELSVDRGFKLSVNHVTFEGGAGAKACPPGQRGGNVVLMKSKAASSFGPLESEATISAQSWTSAPSVAAVSKRGQLKNKQAGPQGGSKSLDRVILVPMDTKVYDSVSADLVPFTKGVLVVAQGGGCGEAPTHRQLDLESHPFVDLETAKRLVSDFGFPYVLAEHNHRAFLFILKGSKEALNRIVKKQRRTSPYSASHRTEWYEARWSDLHQEEDSLVIRPVRPGMPDQYEVSSIDAAPTNDRAGARKSTTPPSGTVGKSPAGASAKAGAPDKTNHGSAAKLPVATRVRRALRKKAPGHYVRIPFSNIEHGTVTTVRHLPNDAWLVMEGVKPSQFWYYPLLYLLLVGFVLFNVMAVVNYFKYVHKSGDDSAS